jgi:uridine phosphorylase
VDLPLFEDDLAEAGLIEATMLHRRDVSLPAVAVLCFFSDVLDRLSESGELVERYRLRSEMGVNPVYEMMTPAGPVAVVHPGVGAPLAAGFAEEMIGLGARTLVACGGAGALVEGLSLGHVMVVASALRDEGTSFHYAPASRTIDADELGVRVASAALRAAGVEFLVGRTWTTDGFLRETRSRVARRVDEDCLMVDMESAAFIAVARYRGVRFAQMLYAGDTLAGETWDSRHWVHAGDVREQLLRVAIEAALALASA